MRTEYGSLGRQDEGRELFWAEIVSISGYRLEAFTSSPIILALDFEYGHFVELNDEMVGFESAVAAITSRLPGIASDWFDSIRQLSPADEAIVVWQGSLP